jgi:hypothetical protein
MAIPCKDPYIKPQIDWAYVAKRLGEVCEDGTLDEFIVSKRLHKLKKSVGMRGASVVICLDDGDVYIPSSEENIGNLCDD